MQFLTEIFSIGPSVPANGRLLRWNPSFQADQSGGTLAELSHALGAAATAFRAGRRHSKRVRQAVRELQRLDDRMLSDIGVNRGEIRAVVEAQIAGQESPARKNGRWQR